jgi:hypothetical protein
MRSVVVVLPASICAMMPIFRYRSRGVVRAMKATPLAPREAGALKENFVSVVVRFAGYQR